MWLLKKIGEFILILLKNFHKHKLLIASMVILMLGSNSCSSRLESNVTLGFLILTKNANIHSHFGFNDGGINLDVFTKYFLTNCNQLSNIFLLPLPPKWIDITSNFHIYSVYPKHTKFLGFSN